MKNLNLKIIKGLGILLVGLFSLVSTPVLSDDTTTYVRLNSNPYAAPFYIFSNEPNGDSINLSLEKGSSHTFIRTDSGHAFNIGDAWRTANSEISVSSNGSGGIVSGVASINDNEQLTVTIPLDFSGDSLSYFCYPHSSMIASFDIVENTSIDSGADDNGDSSNEQLLSWDFDANGEADALTDGLLLLRYAFGLRDEALTSGALALNATKTSQQIQDSLSSVSSIADIDGDGEIGYSELILEYKNNQWTCNIEKDQIYSPRYKFPRFVLF